MSHPEETYAAIDIGANSTRLLIAGVDAGVVRPKITALRMSRIGEGMTKGRGLQPEPVARTLQALKEFQEIITRHAVSLTRVVATSAVRDAPNAVNFASCVQDEVGLQVEVISGEEEAFLSYLGACHAIPGAAGAVVLDIGGGSTEFTYRMGKNNQPASLRCHSVPLGAMRLTEEPLLPDQLIGSLKPILDEIKKCQMKDLVGVGGTITTLAAIDQALEPYLRERIQGYRLSKTAVERILFCLAAKNSEERKRVPGLQPERAEIIVSGIVILWAILGYLQAPELTVSDADILHGIIITLALAKSHRGRKNTR